VRNLDIAKLICQQLSVPIGWRWWIDLNVTGAH